jgi:methylated-DNA-[protein]-cysteine S-methyltransferase
MLDQELPVVGSVLTPQLGEVWVAVSERGLVTVEFGVSRATFDSHVRKQTRRGIQSAADAGKRGVTNATRQIAEYLQGKRRAFDLPIDWSILGSEFQRVALSAVMAIPYGETRTYGQVAAQIGYPQSPRAVGRANATNPMPLVIPCHRVIGSDGKLHGYGGAGGLRTKEWLLNLEGAAVPRSARASLARSMA